MHIKNDSSKALADPALLEKIDKLFEAKIGDLVDLPQLVVVGDQSSGKSSILEGLTRLPFPRDNQLCTRFATQVTFQRGGTAKKVFVSVVPAKNASNEHAQKLRTWKKEGLQELTREHFADIMQEVHTLMGIDKGEQSFNHDGKTFSNDVLKINIIGPDEDHLSIIDIPGIFRNSSDGKTTDQDKALVRTMVEDFMANPRSVILAVVPANVDLALQEILEIAKVHDKEGQRTLGVLTKPDIVDEGSEPDILEILNGKMHKLRLGWCVVRNASQKNVGKASFDRASQEDDFFANKHPWNTVDKTQAGIGALRSRLIEVLSDIVEREFPKVKAELGQRLKECKGKLANLGPPRDSKVQQFQVLIDLATRFQKVSYLALNSQYGSDKIFEDRPSLKLATAVVRRNEEFNNDVWKMGHRRDFVNDFSSMKIPDESEAIIGTEEPAVDTNKVSVRKIPSRFDIEEILYEGPGIALPDKSGMVQWLKRVYKESRGFELGTIPATILPTIWNEQSSKWENLAKGYVSDITCLVHQFIADLLAALSPDQRLSKILMGVMLENLIGKYTKGLDHADFVLSVERDGPPTTTNHYFADNLEKSRQERLSKAVEPKQFCASASSGYVVKVSDLASTKSNVSNLQHTVADLHDILRSYYKVARKRFVDVLCMQAANYHLVAGPDAPIKAFSPAWVSALSDEQLEKIAGEDQQTKKRRADLTQEMKVLEKGKAILI